MEESCFRFVCAVIRSIIIVSLFLAPSFASAQGAASVISGTVKDSSGGVLPGVSVKVTNETTNTSADIITNPDGIYASEPLTPGPYRVSVSLDGFETVEKRIVVGRRPAGDQRRHAEPGALLAVGRRHGAARRGTGAGRADSGIGRQGRPCLRRGRVQREPPEGNDSDGAVLQQQPAQLGHQHPRPRRAVRPDQRRPRARRRPLHRRRVLRAARFGDARFPRRRSGRGPARTAGHALREEHDRRRDQRHHAQAVVHAWHRARGELRQPAVRAGQGLGDGPDRREMGRPRIVLRHAARRHDLQREIAAGHERAEQRRPARPAPLRAVGQRSQSRSPSTTRVSGPTATRRWSPAWRRPNVRPTGNGPPSRRI